MAPLCPPLYPHLPPSCPVHVGPLHHLHPHHRQGLHEEVGRYRAKGQAEMMQWGLGMGVSVQATRRVLPIYPQPPPIMPCPQPATPRVQQELEQELGQGQGLEQAQTTLTP